MAQQLTTRRVLVGLAGRGAFGFGPRCGGEGWYFGGLCFGEAFKNVLEIFGGIEAVAPATAQHRIDHGAALPGLRMANEQKVFLADGRRANAVLTKVMPPPDLCRVAKPEGHIPAIPDLIGYQSAA